MAIIRKTKPESFVSDILASKLNGQREVKTKAGRIDVLTSKELIEVKRIERWRDAIGQLIAYGSYYPTHQLRLHLIGKPTKQEEKIIVDACRKISAIVTAQDPVFFSKEEMEAKDLRDKEAAKTLEATFLAMTSFSLEYISEIASCDEVAQAVINAKRQATRQPVPTLKRLGDYYGDTETGQCGMSRRALGEWVGKDHKAITYWEQKVSNSDVGNNTLPKCFKPLAGQPLTLGNNNEKDAPLKDVFCNAVVNYYACYAKPEDQTEQAKDTLLLVSAVGMRTLLQKRLNLRQPESQPTTQPPSTQPTLPAALFMSAELTPDNELYQLFREAGKREIVRKFYVS